MNRLFAACALVSFALPVAAAAQAPATAPSGLHSLSDDKLIAELAERGLDAFLERAFEVNNVPPAQREGMRTLVALRQLAQPGMSSAQRRSAVARVAAGIEAALPSLNDPNVLMQQATALLQYGVERDVSTLEYWGENPRTQAALKPIVEAVIKLLEKAAAVAQKQADDLANQITGPNDPRAAQWEAIANLATSAAYTRHMVDYYLCLSLDRVASRQLKDVAAAAIKYLAQFDTPDSTVQPIVRLRVAKLHMLRGDYAEAREAFLSIANNVELTPPPDPATQWEARYFLAVNELLAGKLDAAQEGLDAVVQWQAEALPKDEKTQAGVTASTAVLRYRILAARAEAATDPAAKAQANDQAVALLMDLLKKRPDLQSVIFEQLMAKLPPAPDLRAIDPLLLQGYVVRADAERLKSDAEKPDHAALQRGVEAAKEMLRRSKENPASVDPQMTDTAALLIGFFLERQGKSVQAASALLDYVEQFYANFDNATIALDNALAIIGRLRANPATADTPEVVKAYERILPIAIKPPFSRKEFAYEYARRLQANGKFKEAIEQFRAVPEDDARATTARYFEMVALQQRLDQEKLEQAERDTIAIELSKVIPGVRQQVSAAMDAATDPQEKLQYRSMLVRTTLLAADAARRQQDNPKRALELLENFESLAAGLPNEQELIGNVLYIRVQAFMALGDSDAATRTLVTLLQNKPGDEGATIVYKLLEKLNTELDQARLADDRQRMQRLARNRAELSGFLVKWAKENPDPNIQRFTYRYSVFDAATKHQAAELDDDPTARRAGLEAALKLYHALESPEMTRLYHATLEENSPARAGGDPAVSLGIGLIAYDLGDYAEAQKRLGQLLTERKLGTPTIPVDENGQSRIVENDQYWQATLKLMRSNLAIAAAQPNDPAAQQAREQTVDYLRQLYVQWGRELGGQRWSPEFEKMRAELIPDFDPDVMEVQQPPEE